MKIKLLQIIIFLFFYGCSSPLVFDEDLYKFKNEKFVGQRKLTKQLFENNSTKAEGEMAISTDGIQNNLKIGEWIFYYNNGQIKSKGKYEIGKYIDCCNEGRCILYYNYKIEEWKYFYPNGKLNAKGYYSNKPLHLNTNCKGGAKLKFGIINSNWEFYDKKSQRIVPNDSMIFEFEKVFDNSFKGGYLIPNKEKNEIKFKSEK